MMNTMIRLPVLSSRVSPSHRRVMMMVLVASALQSEVFVRGEGQRGASVAASCLLQKSTETFLHRQHQRGVTVGHVEQAPLLGDLLKRNVTAGANRTVVVVHHVYRAATTTPTTTTTTTTTPNTTNVTNATLCTVVANPNTATWFGASSEPGAACIFGVDKRDEGAHCIDIASDKYGSFGWCYTAEDKSSWGSCGEMCPLMGPLKKVGDMLEAHGKVHEEVKKRLDTVLDTLNTTTSAPAKAPTPETTAPDAASATNDSGAAPASPADAAASAAANEAAPAAKDEAKDDKKDKKKKKKNL